MELNILRAGDGLLVSHFVEQSSKKLAVNSTSLENKEGLDVDHQTSVSSHTFV